MQMEQVTSSTCLRVFWTTMPLTRKYFTEFLGSQVVPEGVELFGFFLLFGLLSQGTALLHCGSHAEFALVRGFFGCEVLVAAPRSEVFVPAEIRLGILLRQQFFLSLPENAHVTPTFLLQLLRLASFSDQLSTQRL